MQTNKLNGVIEYLISDMTPRQIWHLCYNKMSNQCKKQLVNEILNEEISKIGEDLDGCAENTNKA